MVIKEILVNDGVLIVDPKAIKETPDEFLAKYGSYMDSVCLIAKSEAGTTFYPSFTAPKDQEHGDFFSSFAQIASDIGIKVFAIIHSNIDYYLSQNPNFQMKQSGGSLIRGYICPIRQQYWYYLAELGLEVAKHPIEGIIFKDATFPRENTCFCENCKREFAEKNKSLGREFDYKQIKSIRD